MEDDKLAQWLENEFDKGQLGKEPALERILEVIDKSSVPTVDADRLWANIDKAKATPKRSLRLVRWASAVAALLIGLLFVTQLLTTDIHIQNTDRAAVVHTLPDGSEVILNTNSAISYKKDFLQERTLTLTGEAFYQVARGSRFTVETASGTVQVLGTSFNVFVREDLFAVSCKTGKVSVNTKIDSRVLEPGDRVSLRQGKLVISATSPDHIDQWVSGNSAFENAPMLEVISALKSKYDLTVLADEKALAGMHFTGSFVNDDMRKALEMVFLPMDIKYVIKNDNTLELQH